MPRTQAKLLHLPVDLLAQLAEIADKNRRSTSQQILWILEQYVQDQQTTP